MYLEVTAKVSGEYVVGNEKCGFVNPEIQILSLKPDEELQKLIMLKGGKRHEK